MKRSKIFIPSNKASDTEYQSKSLELALRSGLIYQTGSGLYSYTPIGHRVLSKISDIIRKEMNTIDAQEILLPSLQPRELWDETGRWGVYQGTMFAIKGGDGKEYCMAPTCEEAVCDFVRGNNVKSHKQLPLTLFQISNKYRDETVRQGLIRTNEFIMKDAYSFNLDEEDLNKTYDAMRNAYVRIFNAFNINYVIKSAEPGEMGGGGSEEFLALTDIGGDTVRVCHGGNCKTGLDVNSSVEKCASCGGELKEKKAVELGHVFKLGTRYSEPMGLNYIDSANNEKTMVMGCYGIGVSRLIPVIIEQHNDEKGIIWPELVAPFKEVIIPTNTKQENLTTIANSIYEEFISKGREPLLDDRDGVSAGVKFAESDLLGIPRKIIIGPKSVKNANLEIEFRNGEKQSIPIDGFVNSYLNQFP